MGVEFFPCCICGETICDCGEFHFCEHCCNKFCSEECAGFDHSEDEDNPKCCVCCKVKATDYLLLTFLLKRAGLTREQAEEEWRNEGPDE